VDFIDACSVIFRRWYVVVPLLILTAVGTMFAYSTGAAEYTAKGSMVLLAPAAAPEAVSPEGKAPSACETNPWCAGNNVSSLGNVTARGMSDPSVANPILDDYPGGSYEVELDPDNRSPIVTMSAVADSPQGALGLLREVRTQVQAELRRRQLDSGVSADGLIISNRVTMANQASVQSGVKLRAAAAAFGLGIAVTLGGAFLAESMAKSRRMETSLLERISLPDQAAAASAATSKTKKRPAARVPAVERTVAEPDTPQATASGQTRSGRVGS